MFGFSGRDSFFDSGELTWDNGDPLPPDVLGTAERWCRSDAEIAAMLAALRPRGDAWRNGGFDALEGSVMGRFFAALGAAFGPTDRRMCALIDEFFCATAQETREIWLAEYGMPDPCDPFAELCDKVNAVGDTTPAYVAGVALRHGWAVTIAQAFTTKVEAGRCGPARAGRVRCAARQGVLWTIRIDLSASSAFRRGRNGRAPLAGCMLAGDRLNCPPDIAPLRCIVRRIAPAHADLRFTTTP